MKKAIVFGAGGFIGTNLTIRLKEEGYHVRGVDLKYPEFSDSVADDFIIADLRDPVVVNAVIGEDTDILFQMAGDFGGSGYILSGKHDANIFYNSAIINLNTAHYAAKKEIKKMFFPSSAMVYNVKYQKSEKINKLKETMAYPAQCESEYAWEKLMAERLYSAYNRTYGLDIRIARFHNVYGELGNFYDGKERVISALCRKIVMAKDGAAIDVWGSGNQVRSFLYINDCLDGVFKLMDDPCRHRGPINIGSEVGITIHDLAKMIIDISGKKLSIKTSGALSGVAGRTSDNTLVKTFLKWEPKVDLRSGLTSLYSWTKEELSKLSISHERNPESGKIRSTVVVPDRRTGQVKRYSLD